MKHILDFTMQRAAPMKLGYSISAFRMINIRNSSSLKSSKMTALNDLFECTEQMTVQEP